MSKVWNDSEDNTEIIEEEYKWGGDKGVSEADLTEQEKREGGFYEEGNNELEPITNENIKNFVGKWLHCHTYPACVTGEYDSLFGSDFGHTIYIEDAHLETKQGGEGDDVFVDVWAKVRNSCFCICFVFCFVFWYTTNSRHTNITNDTQTHDTQPY